MWLMYYTVFCLNVSNEDNDSVSVKCQIACSFVKRMKNFMSPCNVAICNISLLLLLICNVELCPFCMKRFRNFRDRKAKHSDTSAFNGRVLNYV